MSVFSFVRRIYALDTLDTRFISSTSTPHKSVVDTRSDSAVSSSKKANSVQGAPVRTDSNGRPKAQPSKWNTLEFYFYYFIFIITVPYMFWVAYDVSRPSDKNYPKYEHLLSPGWIPGRKIDLTDAQYSTFRGNVPYLAILLFGQPLLRRLYDSLWPSPTRNGPSKTNGSPYIPAIEADARLNRRASFDFGFAFVFLAAMHGVSALKILLILYVNFSIGTRLPRKFIPAVTWIFNVSILFANELCGGYKFADIASSLLPVVEGESLHHSWGAWLDGYGGIMSRWEVLFNLTVLRLISFNMDYYFSLDARSGSPIEKQLDPANLSERDRIATPAAAKDFNFRNYIGYAIYAPLYLTGPIITFNDYISQLKYPPATIQNARTVMYGVRFLLCLLAMELVLHFDYCVAISKGDPNWSDYTPAQLSLLSYFSLHVIWLKLLLPWRFFRLWALIDGIDPPENMLRCISNTYSTITFWRSWHRSFNRWLVRYIFVPLGGTSSRSLASTLRTVVNYILIFTFVALWHDISLHLLIWGWLIVFFMMPEIIAGYLFPRRNWEKNLTAYRLLCGVGAVGNVMMMMTANLVGFAVGVDGLKSIIYGIFKDHTGVAFLVTASSALFVGIQVMFEIRQAEMRRGIFLKC